MLALGKGKILWIRRPLLRAWPLPLEGICLAPYLVSDCGHECRAQHLLVDGELFDLLVIFNIRNLRYLVLSRYT